MDTTPGLATMRQMCLPEKPPPSAPEKASRRRRFSGQCGIAPREPIIFWDYVGLCRVTSRYNQLTYHFHNKRKFHFGKASCFKSTFWKMFIN